VAPNFSVAYENLAASLQAQGKCKEGEAVLGRAQNKGLDEPVLRYHQLALLCSDAATLERERTWMAKNVDDPLVISMQTRIDLQVGGFSPRVYDSGDPGLISVAFPS
jgi:hypothetical protein